MLAQFRVTNYRSIRGDGVLRLVAGTDKTHEECLSEVDQAVKVLPVAIICGANAAGKSNVIHALQQMTDLITGEAAKPLKGKGLPFEPFAFTEDASAPTEMEITFYSYGWKYLYGFSYDAEMIRTEYLYHWPNGREALIFSRINDAYEFRDKKKEQMEIAKRTPDNRLYLVQSNEFNLRQTAEPYDWIMQHMNSFREDGNANATASMMLDTHSELHRRILKELQVADLGIRDVGVSNSPDNPDEYTVLMVHHTGGKQFGLPLNRQSEGTQRFFTKIGPLVDALIHGKTLVMDELDASMHPLLTRRLLEMMQNPEINANRAQLICTTHETQLLDLGLLRRDQVWFAEKDPDTLETELFCLADFQVRKTENIRNGYLRGRYGAVPFLEGGAAWPEA